MEVRGGLSEFLALKELYGLLQENEELEQNASYKLDEGARILLKKLLDGAKERVLEVCSKQITAAQSRKRISRWSSLLEALQKLKPHNPQYSQYSSSKRNFEEDLNRQTIALSNPKSLSTKTGLKDILELSKFSLSRQRSQNEMEQCRVCQKCGRKQKLAAEIVNPGDNSGPDKQGQTLDRSAHHNVQTLKINEKATVAVEGIERPRNKNIHEFPSSSSPIRLLGSSSDSRTTRIVKLQDSTDCVKTSDKFVSRNDYKADIASSIRGLDFCISSLQGCSDFVEDAKHQVEGHGLSGLSDSGCFIKKNDMQRKCAEPSVKGFGLPSQRTNQLCHWNMKDIVQNIKPLNELGSQTDSRSQSGDTVYGLRVPLRQENIGQKAQVPVQSRSHIIDDTTRKSRLSEEIQKAGTTFLHKTSDPGKSFGVKKAISREKNLQVILRPTLLDYMSTDYTLGQSSHDYHTDYKRSGIRKKDTAVSQDKKLQYDEESDDMDSGSSSWTTQQTSASMSERETCSSSRESSGNQFETSSYASVGSSSSVVQSGSDYSSEDSAFLSATESSHGSVKHSHGMTSRRYRSEQKPAGGRLKKFKDKLALIFHHHHHHHHHYKTSENINIGRKKSTWKKARGIFPRRNNAGAMQRKSKSVVKKVNHTDNQVGQFHGLVQGLMRHVRHSKKPNKSKVDAKKLGNHHHGKTKKGAKLHWWKLLQHHRTKLPKRGRVKIGMPKKKQRLIKF